MLKKNEGASKHTNSFLNKCTLTHTHIALHIKIHTRVGLTIPFAIPRAQVIKFLEQEGIKSLNKNTVLNQQL